MRVRHMNQKTVNRIVLVMVDDDEDDCLLVEAALYQAYLKCDFHCVRDGLEMLDYLTGAASITPLRGRPART